MCVVLVSIKSYSTRCVYNFITTHRKASFVSVVYDMGGISVCLSVCPSVTLRYYVKMRERRRMQFLPPGSTVSLVFWCQEWLMGDDPV